MDIYWQGCAAGQTGNTCNMGQAGRYTWNQALTFCEDLNWGGDSNWRLPDEFELDSIVDVGRVDPAINTDVFPATPSDFFWSSSTDASDESSAWCISGTYGLISYCSKESDTYYIRCVRGGEAQPPRFERNLSVADQPMVIDRVTTLAWQGCAAGITGENCEMGDVQPYTWENALAYCEALTWGEYMDWRLPNKKELRSIVDSRITDPAMDATAFPNVPGSPIFFWSSSTTTNPISAWYVILHDGRVSAELKVYTAYSICVR